MAHLKRIQLCWSLAALATTCVLGFLSSEFVAKRLIVSQETKWLHLLLDREDTAPENGVEWYSVLADGTLLVNQIGSVGVLRAEDVLRLAFRSQEGSAFQDGWVYASVPTRFEQGTAKGWKVVRSDVSSQLSAIYLVIAGVAAGAWACFNALFAWLQSRLHRAVKGEVETIRSSLGLGTSTKSAEIADTLSELSQDLREFENRRVATVEALRPLAAIAGRASEGIFICDGTGRIEWANDGFLKMVGYSLEEIQESEAFAYVKTEQNDPLYLARLGRAIAEGDSVSLELAGVRPDGGEYWASLELKPLDVGSEGEKQFFGIQIDITDQRRASGELEEVSRRFALAMESANVGIWDWDVKRDKMVWDEHTFGLYGVSHAKFKPSYHSWMSCIDPDDTNRVVRLVDSCLANADNIDLVFCVRRTDGSEAYVKCVGRAFLNDVGEVIRYIGIASDVTAEHRAKKNLIEQKEEAETLAIRLAEAVRQSKNAAAEARQATRAKSAFLAMMSHEIRTPMNGVIGMASLLLETELDEYQRDYLNTIRISGDTLLTLINDILDYSKIESGKLEIEKAPFSIRECVEEASDLLASKASEKRVELLCRIDPNTPGEVVGDITRLRQVLVNLVGNAIKFTDVGEVVIQVHPPCYGKVHFSVRDTGIGIPEDRMNRLFEVFSQVDSSTTRKYGGSGLGLSISKQLATLMGGEMWVESSAGRGSVFHFDIAFDGLEEAQLDPVFCEQETLKGRRILVAQPNSVLRDYLDSLSRHWGMDTRAVSSIENCSPEDVFEIALIDEGDPALDGEDRIEKLNALRKASKVVVQLQGHGNPEKRSLIEQYVLKPCKVASLLEAFKSIGRGPKECAAGVASKELVSDVEYAVRLPLRILVADDNSVNQKVARMMLKKFGYSADLVANGVEAVEAVKRRDYDLVFMDCQMPEMDGFEATRLIRQIEKDRGSVKRAYIFALTANVRGESIEMSKDSGMNGFLAKPIKLVDIKNALVTVEADFVGSN